MRRLDLQPGTAQAGIIAAQSAGGATAAAAVPAGPVAIGALSLIDAAAGLLDGLLVAGETPRTGAVRVRAHVTGSAATAAVTDLVAIDEGNAQQLSAVRVGA